MVATSPRPDAFKRFQVGPSVAGQVAAAEHEQGAFPKFADIPAQPTDVRPLAAWRQTVGDVVAQTHESLDNIEALISEDNLDRHGLPGFGSSLEGLGMVRVYVKRNEDYPRIQAVCAKRIGEVPTIYVTADVCRPELLVEIEGIAFSRREPSPSGSVVNSWASTTSIVADSL